jgi:YidC/Oxa1 family membrane protein insertase
VDKRTVVAIVLIGLIIILYPLYLKLIGVAPKEPTEQEEVISQPEVEPKIEEKITSPLGEPRQLPISVTEAEPETVTVESDLFRGTINTKGAVLTSWEMKPKLRNVDKQNWVSLLPTVMEKGALSLTIPTGGYEIDLDELIFETQDEALMLDVSNPEGSLSFRAETAQGLKVVKIFSFHHRKHTIGLRVIIEGAGALGEGRQYTLWWKPGLNTTERKRKDDLRAFAAYAMLGDELVKTSIGRDGAIKDSSFTGDTKWIAMQTKYFLMAMMTPEDVVGRGVKFRGYHEKENEDQGTSEQKIISAGLHMPLREGMCDHSWEIYLGPMDYFVLKDYGLGLERMVNLGFKYIRWIGLIILHLFVNIYRIIPNYGVVIIIFSIVVKILFYPLTRKSFESMRKMQDIQPAISKLREKYKSDPARLNKETLGLYRKYKINPASGCFPMLLQMPVFIALYAVFRNTIELRGESFLWIKDLSAPDTVFHLPWELPLYGNAFNILPIIMAVTMFIQQKISMKDPKQAYMVYMMPIFLFFLFNNFSSGLVLYWTLFNLLTILQENRRRRRQPSEITSPAKDADGSKKL